MMATSTPPAADGFGDRMSSSDALLWDIEQDPVLRSTICAIALFDRPPDFDRLRRRLDYASRVIPRMRQRAEVPPFRLGLPRWVVDRGFDLDYHVRRIQVPAPATWDDVLELALPLASAPFDRSRPLWEFTVVEGMAGGQSALIEKVHHTVTDGVGGIALALAVLDDRPDGPERDLPPEPDIDGRGRGGRLAADMVGRAWASAWAGLLVPPAATRAGVAVLRDPIGASRRAAGLVGSVAKMLAPVPQSASPIMTDRGLQRCFDTLEFPLDDLHRAARAAGCTTNDAFLAATVEGLRLYHQRHGVTVDELRLTMPISLRHEGDPAGGNHFAPVRFSVPVGVADPVDRMRSLGEIARRWRREPALAHVDTIAAMLDRLPVTLTTNVFGAMLKHVDAVVTNVPGIPVRSWLAGAEMLRHFAFAPPTGAAVNVSLVSHIDTACIGVVSDCAAVPDHTEFTACLRQGFEQVLTSRPG